VGSDGAFLRQQKGKKEKFSFLNRKNFVGRAQKIKCRKFFLFASPPSGGVAPARWVGLAEGEICQPALRAGWHQNSASGFSLK